MNQRHYDGETYQMQIDSHLLFKKDWDTKNIKMLHSTDAGEYSVLTTYGNNFDLKDRNNTWSEILYRNH